MTASGVLMGGRDLKMHVVLLSDISRKLYVILISLYIFVDVDMVVLVR
jgi:hypothetical protein